MEIFVNGRICLAGEHSDWASEYKSKNKRITPGKSIIFGLNQGILADVEKSNDIIVKTKKGNLKISTNLDKLYEHSKKHDYFSYCTAASYIVLKKYDVKGINVNILKEDLPIKKGLASSAAICILIIRSFNKLYNLNMDIKEEMDLAYQAERLMGIKCGKMDQLCAYGEKFVAIDYKDNSLEEINVKENMYFVFADLNSKKDTKLILESLNTIYPKAKNIKEIFGHLTLGIISRTIVNKMIKNIQKGNVKEVGRLMTKSQKYFDKNLAYLCESELTSPKLHSLLNDQELQKLSYGMKGVGSQGDGSIQILAKDEKTQKEIYELLKTKDVIPYIATIKRNPINKAVIALCGKGTRLYPYTKFVTKEFCPVIHKGKLKPQINVLLEYIYDSGIREIVIAISNRKQKKQYKDYFYKTLDDSNKEYDSKLKKIYKCIKFIIVKDSIGFGDTVLRFRKVANNEPVILFLGDTLYDYNESNCIELIKNNYDKYQSPLITISPKEDEEVPSCGICSGKVIDRNIMKIDKIVEKPNIEYCKKNLQTNKKSYGIYGCYLITNEIFDNLEDMKLNKKDSKEMQLTDALINTLDETNIYGIMLEKNSLDFGNVNDYARNFSKLSGEKHE